MQMIGNKKFYTCAEVAEAIGMRESTVRLYVRQGSIPAVKIGRSYRISEDTVRDYVKEKYQIEL